MIDERMVKKVFLGNPGGRRKPGRPRLRWLDCVQDDVKTLGVKRWRKRAEDCEECAIILKEAMVKLKELYAKEEEDINYPQPTPWSRIIPEKVKVTLTVFYENLRYITTFTTACQGTLS
jgi:hypothetical protein